ncbi:uncharacterized protein LOC133734535 [Rosa rugosa]|uniref:uncharacterized protein LOC133734535 n=1 Tax=Rosa rugosa TaxID=74645 RepID=UPI002B40D16A|nr:uncharacterized protein LOC133734535 [Rosa rugosa]
MWNVDFIRSNFLIVDVEKILSIPLCERSWGDVVIWHYAKDGYYTVKSGYWLGMELKRVGVHTACSGENAVSNSKNIWSIIWGLSVPNKVKLFLWRACHAFLPCAERLFKRKVCSSDVCGRCGVAQESVLHSLWECQKARKGRNDVLHGKPEMDPLILVQRCLEWHEELSKLMGSNSIAATGAIRVGDLAIEVSHNSNPVVFFDGAVNKDTGIVGLGAVVLRSDRSLLGALSVPLPFLLTPAVTEALALWHGLNYCKELGVQSVVIKGDALNVLNGLKVDGWDLSEIGGVLDAVGLMMHEFELVSWKQVKKRFNAIAHHLARSALTLPQAWYCKEQGTLWIYDLIAEN